MFIGCWMLGYMTTARTMGLSSWLLWEGRRIWGLSRVSRLWRWLSSSTRSLSHHISTAWWCWTSARWSSSCGAWSFTNKHTIQTSVMNIQTFISKDLSSSSTSPPPCLLFSNTLSCFWKTDGLSFQSLKCSLRIQSSSLTWCLLLWTLPLFSCRFRVIRMNGSVLMIYSIRDRWKHSLFSFLL